MARSEEQAKAFGAGSTCDACSAAPLTSFVNHDREFLFCGHHASKNEVALNEAGYSIVHDFRDDAPGQRKADLTKV